MGVAETELEAGEGALIGPPLVVVVLGWPEVAVETRLRAAVTAGCEGSFRLEEDSRAGVAATADEGSLPRSRKEDKIM